MRGGLDVLVQAALHPLHPYCVSASFSPQKATAVRLLVVLHGQRQALPCSLARQRCRQPNVIDHIKRCKLQPGRPACGGSARDGGNDGLVERSRSTGFEGTGGRWMLGHWASDGVVVTVHLCAVGRLNWQRERLWRLPHDAPCEARRARAERRACPF